MGDRGSVISICVTCQKPFPARLDSARRFCSLKCRNGRPIVALDCRFWSKVIKSDKCWTWTGAINKHTGYGTIGLGRRSGKTRGAHRVSWELAHGPIPEGLYVCHRCDNKRCVRPDHLFLGTAEDNAQDALRKGRLDAHLVKAHRAWAATKKPPCWCGRPHKSLGLCARHYLKYWRSA
jgi:hypothetical protein